MGGEESGGEGRERKGRREGYPPPYGNPGCSPDLNSGVTSVETQCLYRVKSWAVF